MVEEAREEVFTEERQQKKQRLSREDQRGAEQQESHQYWRGREILDSVSESRIITITTSSSSAASLPDTRRYFQKEIHHH
ncbi:unnamed protein product [Calypogeia fissa]